MIRYLGFSAHTMEACIAALDRYPFDSILFPVNFGTFHKGGFGPAALDKAREHGAKILALKSMARQKWTDGHPKRDQYSKCWYEPLDDPELAWLAMRFTLGQGVTALLPPGEEPLWRMAMEQVPRGLDPLSEEELALLKERAEELDPIFEAAT